MRQVGRRVSGVGCRASGVGYWASGVGPGAVRRAGSIAAAKEACAAFVEGRCARRGAIPRQVTETEMVCQPLAPLGAGGVLCEVCVLPAPSVARTLI